MFDSLRKSLAGVFGGLRGRGLLTEADVKKALRHIRVALLEADVALDAIKALMEKIQAEAVGQKVLKSLTPEQVMIKIVHDHLIDLLSVGDADARGLQIKGKRPLVYLLVGLQGSGKTTSAAKLAFHLKNQGQRPLLCSVDVYRPAAREQLEQLAKQNDLGITPITETTDVTSIAQNALAQAHTENADVLIVDTAGRLQVDESLMQELVDLKALLNPAEILFVADSMMGQEALPVAKAFHQMLDTTGSVLTRTDGDARGGAALSIGFVTGRPLKFLGTSEHIRGLEAFDPTRQADRILDKGDVVSLVQELEQAVDKDDMEAAAKRMQQGQFTLADMEKQLQQMGKIGSFESLLGHIPGMGGLKEKMAGFNDADAKKQLGQQLAIIRSMTPQERQTPSLLNASRKRRVAAGSGVRVMEINRLLKQFTQMTAMMKQMGMMQKKKGFAQRLQRMGRMQNLLGPKK